MLTKNIDLDTVESFGAEWLAFNEFDSQEIELLGSEYFDIITPQMLNEHSTMADFGCGTGRFSKYWQPKVGKIYAIDPSDAVIAAQKLIGEYDNIEIIRASIDEIPLEDNSLDFAMSIGVLHHIPDTQKALTDCVKKVKNGGYFYLYLYYSLDNRGLIFKLLWKLSDFVRFIVCKLPQRIKKVVCEIIAISFYVPFVILARITKGIGLSSSLWTLIPLSAYHNKSFFVIRNDALDRFGTPLEHRFSKLEIEKMMKNAGLSNIIFSDKMPFWHAVGQKII